jgi:hypothetical protein
MTYEGKRAKGEGSGGGPMKERKEIGIKTVGWAQPHLGSALIATWNGEKANRTATLLLKKK